MTKPKIIFFGNGPLADFTLENLSSHFEIVFHAKTKEDLAEVKRLRSEDPSLHGILASFGVLIRSDILNLFEPEGILNLHPSLLPKYRGASPIESAILNGDTEFGVSIMKLAPAMDAGPIYYQTSVNFDHSVRKFEIYKNLAEIGSDWLIQHIDSLPEPQAQNDNDATFCGKFDKSLSPLDEKHKSAFELANEVRAFEKFPKSKHDFFGLDCTVISAHAISAAEARTNNVSALSLHCYDNSYLIIDEIQPAGRKVMDAKSFLNGYAKN